MSPTSIRNDHPDRNKADHAGTAYPDLAMGRSAPDHGGRGTIPSGQRACQTISGFCATKPRSSGRVMVSEAPRLASKWADAPPNGDEARRPESHGHSSNSQGNHSTKTGNTVGCRTDSTIRSIAYRRLRKLPTQLEAQDRERAGIREMDVANRGKEFETRMEGL